MSRAVIVHAILLTYTLVALYPIFLVIINAFKSRKGIFSAPMSLPNAETFSVEGFTKVLARSNFELFFFNSFTVTVVTIVIVLLMAFAAFLTPVLVALGIRWISFLTVRSISIRELRFFLNILSDKLIPLTFLLKPHLILHIIKINFFSMI